MVLKVEMPIISLTASAGYLVLLLIFGYCGYSMYQLVLKTNEAIAESYVVVFDLNTQSYPDTVNDEEDKKPSRPIELPTLSLDGKCFVGGCSGQICSDQRDVVSTCEWTEEYACYAEATCERQLNGQCGWTQSTDLLRCLHKANTSAQDAEMVY